MIGYCELGKEDKCVNFSQKCKYCRHWSEIRDYFKSKEKREIDLSSELWRNRIASMKEKFRKGVGCD